MITCPRCNHEGMREQVSILMDGPAGSNYDKAAIRQGEVKVMGMRRLLIYCPICGYTVPAGPSQPGNREGRKKNPGIQTT